MALSNECSHHTVARPDWIAKAGLAIQRWGGLARGLFEATWGGLEVFHREQGRVNHRGSAAFGVGE